ncbi:MAG TPA: DUF742 domain-containing protein [Natronosporangium sp.]
MISRDGPEPAGSEPAGRGTPPNRPAAARIRPYLKASLPPVKPPTGDSPKPTDGGGRPRPFVLTAGRVDGVDPDISLETQVSARPVPPPTAPPVETLPPELQAIIEICAEPVSVAEISARVPLHFGVTRILVGDLRASGYLDVHTSDVANPHDPATILRVIRGLRAIA